MRMQQFKVTRDHHHKTLCNNIQCDNTCLLKIKPAKFYNTRLICMLLLQIVLKGFLLT